MSYPCETFYIFRIFKHSGEAAIHHFPACRKEWMKPINESTIKYSSMLIQQQNIVYSCLPWMFKYSENIESLTRVCNACNSENIETKRKWSLEYKINVRETEESINNGQSRETGFHVFRIRGRLREHLSSSLIFLLDPFLLIVLVFCVVLLCILTFVHLCCEVRYNFRMKNDISMDV
jgi:hypothetical protein